MLFNSLNFLIFFPLVTAAFFILPHKFRWLLLLLASCYFYMAFVPYYILILAFTIIVDYIAGFLIEGSQGRRKKYYLIASIVANVGVLFIFKYFNFFNQNLDALAAFLHWNYSIGYLSIILPIGLSFHTFQSLAYTIEVYRGHHPAEKHFGIFALYVMFYPQLVAGPIERPQNLLSQFHEVQYFDWSRIFSGLQLMLWGFFKKLVIADNLADFVTQAFGNPGSYSAPTLIMTTVFFAFQIYCDFSGYSDIAIGAARVMGIKLMDNFRQPYFSKSIAEFWRRWHISLSTWFKDYVYIPLGGSRVSRSRHYFNLLITFVLSGIWHGANWTYVIWGLLNGVYLVIATALSKIVPQRSGKITGLAVKRFKSACQILLTFALVCLAWIFFRVASFQQALLIIGRIFTKWDFVPSLLRDPAWLNNNIYLGLPPQQLYWCLFSLAVLLIADILLYEGWFEKSSLWANRKLNFFARWFLITNAILLIIILAKSASQQFIYFQF